MFADAGGELRGTVTQDSLQQVLDHYNAGDWNAERALITGDLIQDDSAEAYDRFRELLLPLNMRMHCVPGNHDVRDLMRAVCVRPPFSYCAKEEIGDWLLVGLDSCISGEAGGEVTAEELERLDEIVAASAAKHIMVCLHHPPIPLGSAWLDTVKLKNGDELLQRLQQSAVCDCWYLDMCTNPTTVNTMVFALSAHLQPVASSSPAAMISQSTSGRQRTGASNWLQTAVSIRNSFG